MQRTFWPMILVAAIAPGLRADGPPLADCFRADVARIEAKPLQGIDSADAWKSRRDDMQCRLRSMMGLDPLPERTDLKAQVTGTVEKPDFVIEKIVFQSRPGLYVTADLYRPKVIEKPLPGVLYVCGHAKVEKDGVIYGNKAGYQHHGEWFGANGYVCLVVDTLQLGELPGLHHGTYREGMWWWQSRGYTPAGVEAWNGIRAIDYLCSRPDVDKNRLGVTGRSGGGATSWWMGALDDRLKVVVPVAGITDLRNHVVDPCPDGHYDAGVIEGHCDCMYFVNTDRWDFGTLAALVAPKAMLVENGDHDPIFPEAGVKRVFDQAAKVYDWYGARDKLDLFIGNGGHVDSPEIRHTAFAFFETHLKGKPTKAEDISEPDRKVPVEELKVLKPGEMPADCKNATIHETFVAPFTPPEVPKIASEWDAMKAKWLESIRSQVFGGWPTTEEAGPLDVKSTYDEVRDGARYRVLEFSSEPGVRLEVWLLSPKEGNPKRLRVLVSADQPKLDTAPKLTDEAIALISPRGYGSLVWPKEKETHIRRRFALIGQTLDGMRVWDVRRGLAALREQPELKSAAVEIKGEGPLAAVALWTAVCEPEIEKITLVQPPETVREGPAFLNLERYIDMPQAIELLYPRNVVIASDHDAAWRWTRAVAHVLGPDREWPTFEPVSH